MNLEITDKNLYLLLPGKVSRVAQMYADDRKMPLTEALCRFYGSDTYKRLAEETTKFWHLGPVALKTMAVNNLVNIQYAQTGRSSATNDMGMREMQAMVYEQRNRKHLLVKAPPASGKSRAMMFVALDKLAHQGIRKVIVAVPEKSLVRHDGKRDIQARETDRVSVTLHAGTDPRLHAQHTAQCDERCAE